MLFLEKTKLRVFFLDAALGLEEFTDVEDLPDGKDDEDEGLGDGPVVDARVRGLEGLEVRLLALARIGLVIPKKIM